MANDMGAGQPQQQEQMAAPGEAPAEGGGGAPSMDAMVVQIDQGLTTIADLLSRANPEAGQAMAALNEQYRQIITSVVEQAGGAPAEGAGAQAPMNATQGAGGVPTQF